jgi:hypothetical protein
MRNLSNHLSRMKHYIPIALLLFCCGCCCDKTPQEQLTLDSIYGSQLVDSDYLKYADRKDIGLQTEQVRKEFGIFDERQNKMLHVDAEELAEFNFDFFLPQLTVILGKRNFQLDIKPADNHETSNEVFLNGEKIQLYSDEEFKKGNYRDKAARRFFKKLNELLKKEHPEESFFLLYSDNDLEAYLLTVKQQKIISERYKDEPLYIPYKP